MIMSIAKFENQLLKSEQETFWGFRGQNLEDAETARQCLSQLKPFRCENYKQWIEVGMALHSAGCSWQDWDNWSKGSQKYKHGVCEESWIKFKADGGITVASLISWAKEDNPNFKPKNGSSMYHIAETFNPNVFQEIIPFTELNLPKFPIECMPIYFGNYLREVSDSLQVPVDMPAMLALAACSYCVSDCKISPKADWIEPLNLFVAVVMPSACKKSASLSHILEPLREYEKRAIEDCKEEFIKNQSERRMLEGKQKILEQKYMKKSTVSLLIDLAEINKQLADFQDIFLPTYIASDSTPEAVVRLLFENGGKLGLFNSEGGLFGTMSGRYSNGTPNLDVFLQGHAGDDLKINRIGRPSEHIENPRLTIGLAIQPTILENLKHKLLMQDVGLLARFLFSMPDANHGQAKFYTQTISQNVKDYYENLICNLLNVNKGMSLALESEAEAIFANYNDNFEKRIDGDLYAIQAWAGKLRGAVLRIAGILQLVEDQKANSVSGDTIKSAITIGDYLIEHAKAVFNVMDFNSEQHLANRILKWIKKHSKTEFSLSEVYNALKTSAANSTEDFRAGLDKLAEHNYLNHYKEKTPGRTADKYLVNPDFLKMKV